MRSNLTAYFEKIDLKQLFNSQAYRIDGNNRIVTPLTKSKKW